MLLNVWLIFHNTVASAAVSPVSYWRFENPNATGFDSKGTCNLTSVAEQAPSPHLNTSSSVGSYVLFNAEKRFLNASQPPRNWGAIGCVNKPPAYRNGAGAAGLTIEFLLQPTPFCFLRGGR